MKIARDRLSSFFTPHSCFLTVIVNARRFPITADKSAAELISRPCHSVIFLLSVDGHAIFTLSRSEQAEVAFVFVYLHTTQEAYHINVGSKWKTQQEWTVPITNTRNPVVSIPLTLLSFHCSPRSFC